MNPLAGPEFDRDYVFNTICRAGTYSVHNCFNCYQLFEEERAEVASWFAEAFRQAMQHDEPDPEHWQVFKRAISLFQHKDKWSRVQRWADLHEDSKRALLASFLPALVMAAGIAYVNPSQHFARFYYGVKCQDERPHELPKKISPQLLEALSTPSAKKNELQDIFWEALNYESTHDGHYGLEVEGALPLNGSQLCAVVAARPSPDTLTKNITIDGETYPLSCLLAGSSRAQEHYAKTNSIDSVVAWLQKHIPDAESRGLALKYCILSHEDFYTVMQPHVRSDALDALRILCGKITAAVFLLTKGEKKLKADELMGSILTYWLRPFSWRVEVDQRHITLTCYDEEKSTDTFVQLMRQANGYTFELSVDFPKLPEAVRAQITGDLPITKITLTTQQNKWRSDADVDPLIPLLTRLEKLYVSTELSSVASLQGASQLKNLKISSLAPEVPMVQPLPPALERLKVYLEGDQKHTSPFPATLKRVSFSTHDKAEFDLSTLPEGLEELVVYGHSHWAKTLAPRLPALRNLTTLQLTLTTSEKREPLCVLEHTPSLRELSLKGVVTLADIGAAPHKHVRKITFLPYLAEEYDPEAWLAALQKISSLEEFYTVGPFGPQENWWTQINRDAGKVQLLALAKAAQAHKIGFTINSQTPEFLLANVQAPEKRWY